MSKKNDGAGDVTADLAAVPGALWPMAMAVKMLEGGAELYVNNLKFIEEEIEMVRPILVTPKAPAADVGLSESVGNARDKIADTAAEGRDLSRAASGKIQGAVGRNPFMALLIAFGVGIGLGMISRSSG